MAFCADLRISPAFSNAQVGDTVGVSLRLATANDLSGFQAKALFDPAILEVTDLTINAGLNRQLKKNSNNITGQLWLAAVSLAAPAINGTDIPLATITFKVKGIGTSNIALSGVVLGSSAGEEIAAVTFPAAITTTGDATAPTVDSFTLPLSSNSLTIPVLALTASDSVAVTGYLITENSAAPNLTDPAWNLPAPNSFQLGSIPPGIATPITLYAWAKDAAGNISNSRAAATTVTLPVSVRIAGITPTYYGTLRGAYLAAKDMDTIEIRSGNVIEDVVADRDVTVNLNGGFDDQFNKVPDAFTSIQGNVSLRSGKVVMSGIRVNGPPAPPDVSAPQVSLAVTSPLTDVTVNVSVTATDNRDVTGYLLSESINPPAADDPTAWKTSAPTSYTFADYGDKTLYAFAKDAAGNIGSTSVQVTLTPVLTVQVSGSGTGIVTGNLPANKAINCQSGPDTTGCTAQLTKGQPVGLTAFPGVGSVFGQWGGTCNGTGSTTYSLVIDTSCTVTASFVSAPYVRIGSTSYASLQDAYDKANGGDHIMLQEGLISGQLGALTANRDIIILLTGGYSAAYSQPAQSETIIQGTIAVKAGTVRVENIKIRP